MMEGCHLAKPAADKEGRSQQEQIVCQHGELPQHISLGYVWIMPHCCGAELSSSEHACCQPGTYCPTQCSSDGLPLHASGQQLLLPRHQQ